MKCKHVRRKKAWVEFANNTRHIQEKCDDCGRCLGYAKQSALTEAELTAIPFKETRVAYRRSVGLPTGCLGCFGAGEDYKTGFCWECRRNGTEAFVEQFCDETGTNKWELSKEQLFEIFGSAAGKTALLPVAAGSTAGAR